MGGASKAGAAQAFKLKGTTPALTMLALQTQDVGAIERQLVEQISQMPQFFLHAPVMLDVGALAGGTFDFVRLAAILRENHLVPVAVRNPTEDQKLAAVAAGWGVLQVTLVRPARGPVGSARPEEGGATASASDGSGRRVEGGAPAGPAAAEAQAGGLTIRQPVRSGQVVYAAGGDMVALGPISSGAEIIADGNIHVYAALRGRALAGANDNPDASIFCMSLDAELLSIAGRHMTAEEIPEAQRGKPARVHLQDGRVVVTGI